MSDSEDDECESTEFMSSAEIREFLEEAEEEKKVAKKVRHLRRPCALCPKESDSARLSVFCYNCNNAVCKDHRHIVCDSCTN